MTSSTPQRPQIVAPYHNQQSYLATPSPPRVRHAPGLSRYERDAAAAAAAAQVEARKRQQQQLQSQRRAPLQDVSSRQQQQQQEGTQDTSVPNVASDGHDANKAQNESQRVATSQKTTTDRSWGDGLDVKQVGEWRLGRVIGKGTSGKVKIARSTTSGVYAACKIVPRHAFLCSSSSTTGAAAEPLSSRDAFKAAERARTALEREVAIMKLVSAVKAEGDRNGHGAIMKLYDVHEVRGVLFLLLEYVPGGELFDYLVSRGALPPHEASSYFAQTLSGLRFLHGLGIVHRDLKPENLLLDAHKRIRIADLGMACLMKPIDKPKVPVEHSGIESSQMMAYDDELGDVKLLRTSCGSPHYAAPEVVEGYAYDGRPADLWSLGVILYALLCGRLPFDDPDVRRVLSKVRSGRYVVPRGVDHDGMRLVAGMLRLDPVNRMTMAEITAYPFTRLHLASFDPDISAPVADLVVPSMHDQRYVKRIKDKLEIDRRAFASLLAIWGQGHSEEQRIVRKLMSRGPCLEKTFYWILVGVDDHEDEMTMRQDSSGTESHQNGEPKRPVRRAVRSPSFHDGLAAIVATDSQPSLNPPKTPPPRSPLPQTPAPHTPKTPERRTTSSAAIPSLPQTPKTPRKLSSRTEVQHSKRILGGLEYSATALTSKTGTRQKQGRAPFDDKTNQILNKVDAQSKSALAATGVENKHSSPDSTAVANIAIEDPIVAAWLDQVNSAVVNIVNDYKQKPGPLPAPASLLNDTLSANDKKPTNRLRSKRSASLITATTNRPILSKDSDAAQPKRSFDVIRSLQAQPQNNADAYEDFSAMSDGENTLEIIRDEQVGDDEMMTPSSKPQLKRHDSSSTPLLDSPMQSKSAWLAQFLHLKPVTFTLLSPLEPAQTIAIAEHILAQMQISMGHKLGLGGDSPSSKLTAVLIKYKVRHGSPWQEIDCKVAAVDQGGMEAFKINQPSNSVHIKISFKPTTLTSAQSLSPNTATLPSLTRSMTPISTPTKTSSNSRRFSKDSSVSPKIKSLLSMTKNYTEESDGKPSPSSHKAEASMSTPSTSIATTATTSTSSLVKVSTAATKIEDMPNGSGTTIIFTHHDDRTNGSDHDITSSTTATTTSATRGMIKTFVLSFREMWMSQGK